MTEHDDDMTGLEEFFSAARAHPAEPSAALLARVEAAAEAEQAARAAPGAAVAPPRGAGRWAQLMQALGGWPALGGLATAAVAGLWLGISPLAVLDDAEEALGLEVQTAYLIDTSAEAMLGLGEEAM